MKYEVFILFITRHYKISILYIYSRLFYVNKQISDNTNEFLTMQAKRLLANRDKTDNFKIREERILQRTIKIYACSRWINYEVLLHRHFAFVILFSIRTTTQRKVAIKRCPCINNIFLRHKSSWRADTQKQKMHISKNLWDEKKKTD